MIINDGFTRNYEQPLKPTIQEAGGQVALPQDQVAAGAGEDTSWLIKSPISGSPQQTQEMQKKPPAHLSRELLAQLETDGRENIGPLTARQEKYLDQDFEKPWGEAGILREQPLFGIGGVLMPDSHGRIKHMALQFGNVEFDRPLPGETANALLGVYKTLFANMHPDTKFTITAANEEGAARLKQAVQESGMKNPERVKIINAEAKKGFSIWIRDSMLPVANQDNTTTLLIQDRTYWPGPEDGKIPPLYDEANENINSRPHPSLRIDGGNVVSNQKQIFVGQDSVNHTTDRLRELAENPQWKDEIIKFYETRTGNQVVEKSAADMPGKVTMEEMWRTIAPEVFESEFQRKVFVIGKDNPTTVQKEEQPAFHIDMTNTPIGNDTFLVGDPGMAINILKNLSPEERAQVNRSMAEQAGLPLDADLIGKLIEVNGSPEHQQNFDNTQKELQGQGYSTERIPCLIGLRTTWSLPYITYNNCMMENYTNDDGTQVKKVYLPTYGCEPLEKVATAMYEKHGFEVVPLKMGAISKLEGAIRCSSYALERSDVPPPMGK